MGDPIQESTVVGIGYGTVVGLLLVYFAWENGPHHASHKREIVYLFTVIVTLAVTILTIETNGDVVKPSPSDTQAKNILYLDYTILTYMIMHVFLDSIPSTPSILEGIVASVVKAPPATIRKTKDIEVMVTELHETGRAAFKHMQISNHALAPLYLIIYGVVHSMMASDEGFANFVFYVVTAPCIILFCVVFFKQIFIVMFVNVKKRAIMHEKIKEFAQLSEPEPINFLIHNIDIALMIDDAPWHTVLLFTKEGLSKLTVDSKAILVDALQKRGLRYSRTAAHQIEHLFLSCKGRELTDLKNMTDMGGDYQNLFKLIYSDITDTTTRFKILAHFKTEAFLLKESNGGKDSGLKILSDIDDTLYSSGGKFPAGCDKEYPKHQLYPGVLQVSE